MLLARMGLVQDIGHIVLEVGDMDKALRFYRDTLGFQVPGEVNPTWTVVTAKGGALTLYRKKSPIPCALRKSGSPFNVHVANFEVAADAIERAGYAVHRKGQHGGYVKDPWGNVLWLHDHREGSG